MENYIGGDNMKEKKLVEKIVKQATKNSEVEPKSGNGKTLKKVVKKCL